MNDQIRILIADDHPVVRKGLRMAVEEDPGLTIVAEAADGETALALIERLLPQVAVLDIDMPKLDGFAVARELHKRRLPVEMIFLTMHAQEDLLLAAIELGAKGYLLKDSALIEIVAAVRAVAGGQPYLNSVLTARLLQRQPPPHAPVDRLTPTERRIVQLVADDKSSKEIGAELSIHYRTVENHRTNICRKLGLEGSNALLRFALQNKHSL
ncbi:MAG: response regulator transcription factor [Acidobacteria bacterium]|nr:response regulator transcription factor [Acidobacteriota bacterium]